jgi:hypothetical protein
MKGRIDAAYDNEPPSLRPRQQRAGLPGKCRFVSRCSIPRWLVRDVTNAAATDCPTTYGIPAEREEMESVVELEVSECIRSWRDFFPTFLRLALAFIKHGVSVALPNDG